MEMTSGTVVTVHGAVLDVRFEDGPLPPIDTGLIVDRDPPLLLEVHEHLDTRTVRAVALQSTAGLARGTRVHATGAAISVPVGEAVLGRLLDVTGAVGDGGPPLPADAPRRGIHNPAPALAEEGSATEVFETGIKVIDLLTPLVRGGKAAMFGGAGVGKTVLVMELIHAMVEKLPRHLGLRRDRRALARGARAAARDAGQRRARAHRAGLRPDERAARRALAGGADRARHRRVFPRRRSTRTCCCSWTTSFASSRPAPRSRACSAGCRRRVGYQPTLATEVAALEERIASVAGAAVTAIQAVYVPADDFTDPAVTDDLGHLDSLIVLSRGLAAEGFYPAIDPLASTSALLDPGVVGDEHYAVAERAREVLARFRELQDIIALLGVEELSAADRLIVEARPAAAALPDAALHGHRGLHRHARRQRAARRHPGRRPRHPRRRGRRLGRKLALHGRHASRTPAPRKPPARSAPHEALPSSHPACHRRRRGRRDRRARRGCERQLRHPAGPRRFPDRARRLGGQLARRRRRPPPLRGARRPSHRQRRRPGRRSPPARRSPATTSRPCTAGARPLRRRSRGRAHRAGREHPAAPCRDPPDRAPAAAPGRRRRDGRPRARPAGHRDPPPGRAPRAAGACSARTAPPAGWRRSACSAG